MDTRPPHPFTRPPERTLIHNPNHQSHPSHHPSSQPPQQAHTQPYAGYPPPTSQPQPPAQMSYAADPYLASRRDPFMPPASHHVRRSSYGLHGAEAAPRNERHDGWGNTGTLCDVDSMLEAGCGATREQVVV